MDAVAMEMNVVPGLVAAGWPVGVTVAVLLAGVRVREARRRAALNRAVHELRRPLQALVLSSSASVQARPQAVRVALAALGDLDREINGGPPPFAPRPVACRALVQPAVERWSGIAAAAHRSLILRWRAGSAVVMADPDRLAQALDNLISNAIGHGGLRISVDAVAFAGGVRISVADSGGEGHSSRRRRDPRHGHGLRIVSAVAAQHGGRFLLRTSTMGTRAILELPYAPDPRPASLSPEAMAIAAAGAGENGGAAAGAG